jgi:hypothetical protein
MYNRIMASQSLVPAGPARNGSEIDHQSSSGLPSPDLSDFSELQKHVAQLYGRGFVRNQIAKALVKELVSPEFSHRPLFARHKLARARLANWEQQKRFRDLIYTHAVVKLDLETPKILGAVAGSAKRGRVDAAKLALAVAGRYQERENSQVTAVQVNVINGVPRPEPQR